MSTDVSNPYYKKQINQVIDYIHSQLHKPLSVTELSAQANLSPWHFHRIFSAYIGESLAKYVTRRRLERAAAMIVGQEVKTDGEIGQYEIEEGLYAVGLFEIAMEEFPAAWRAAFELIAEHGCQCTNGYHYEVYRNNRDGHPEKKWVVDIYIPVKYL